MPNQLSSYWKKTFHFGKKKKETKTLLKTSEDTNCSDITLNK
jgi:hypothetical protein